MHGVGGREGRDAVPAVDLGRYDVSADRGFLAPEPPLASFDAGRYDDAAPILRRLDDLAARLPSLLADRGLRPAVRALEPLPESTVADLDRAELVRLCRVAGYLASAYVHAAGRDPVDRLPAGVAVPLYHASQRLGRRPILSYDMQALYNYRQVDPDGPVTIANCEPLETFTRLDDEAWFLMVHVEIEARAGPALAAIGPAQAGVVDDDPDRVRRRLATVADALSGMTATMERMTEGNDPQVFATEYRTYFDGFDGVVYEGVAELDGEPQTLRGGSGAQSTVLPALDAALDVDHAATELLDTLLDMRSYVPEGHREFVSAVEDGPDVRDYVVDAGDPDLTATYNRCVENLREFREVHLGQVMQYVRAQVGDETGTGGTPYMEFLGRMKRETADRTL